MGDPAMTMAAATAESRLWGSSDVMQRVRERIRRIAGSDASVLITGESGSGKELAARMLHECSPRAAAPFVTLNCGALPPSLIEAELFGQTRGVQAVHGRARVSAFERAHGGTLMLDEIARLPQELHSRLLRVLETGRLYRAGGDELAVDVRVIAVSSTDPAEAVRAGRLRQELYYRLAVFPVVMPPLRERGDDPLELAQRLVTHLNAASGRSRRLSAQARQFVRSYSWPGNVRELRNFIERGHLLSDDDIQLGAETAPPSAAMVSAAPGALAVGEIRLPVGTTLEQAERALIVATLSHMRGNKSSAAQTLGCSLKTLYNKLNAYAQLSGAAGA